jgi:hypothetical protein
MGESFIIVNILPNTKADEDKHEELGGAHSDHPRLRLKLFGGPSTGEVL